VRVSDAAEPDAFGAGDIDGCGSAYSAKTAGRLATSLSGEAVPANSRRSGGRVGAAVGVAVPTGPGVVPGGSDAPFIAIERGVLLTPGDGAPGAAARVEASGFAPTGPRRDGRRSPRDVELGDGESILAVLFARVPQCETELAVAILRGDRGAERRA